MEHEDADAASPQEATPVPPPPASVSPSATGLVAGDPEELAEVEPPLS